MTERSSVGVGSAERPLLNYESMTLGELIKQLREDRSMSRSKLLLRYHQELERINPEYPDDEIKSDAWLARVERNQVYVSGMALELLCRALVCDDNERFLLLKYADRLPFITPAGETTVVADVLTLWMVILHNDPRVHQIIKGLVSDQRVYKLQKAELFEIISEVLAIARPAGLTDDAENSDQS